jgi:hypothetical protein
MNDEYSAIPQPGHPGRWIIVYTHAIRGFERDSIDSISYPSREAAMAAFPVPCVALIAARRHSQLR